MVDNNNINMSQFDNNLSSSQDEISLFLRQILLRSSFSSSSNASPLHDPKISPIGSTLAANVSSSSPLGLGGNDDTDDYDCESEEGVEALTEEVPIKSVPSTSKSSSKRSRAAEVHNLSEKRRRSRINEKMKALQDLIPNSNKTDKASMLDEAIEYLKQLQLQVQMLSMRNGLSLHPMCFPEGFQPLQLSRMSMDLSEVNRSTTPLNITATLPQENPLLYTSNLTNKSTLPNHPSVPYPSYINNPQTSFGPESPIPAQKKPFQRSLEPKPIHGEELSQHQQSNANYAIHSQANKRFESGAMATPKDNNSLQTQRDRSRGIMSSESNIILT